MEGGLSSHILGGLGKVFGEWLPTRSSKNRDTHTYIYTYIYIYIYIRIYMIIYKKCMYIKFTYAVRTLQNVLYSLRLKI